MRKRSFGVITLAYMAVMVALYAQMGAIALMLGGAAFTAMGSLEGALSLVLGALYLGLAVAAYVMVYAFWTRKHWSWAGGVVVFATLIVASLLLTLLSADPMAAPFPLLGGVAGLWLLQRPAVKAQLLGDPARATDAVPALDGLGAAEAAH
jgi:hypothetical protein